MLGLLAACAPRPATVPQEAPVRPLDAAAYHRLADGFTPVFEQLRVTIRQASVFGYDGQEAGAFEQALERFYRRNPGFCPLQNAFYPLNDQAVYLTLTARGREIRGFLYDQTQRPKLTFAYLLGTSETVLSTVACHKEPQ